MNSSIVKIVFNEFATAIIEKFGIETTSDELYTMWRAKVKTMKIAISFGEGPTTVVPPAKNDDIDSEPEILVSKKVDVVKKPTKAPSAKTCPYKAVRAPNKGQICGKNTTKDSIMCSAHKKHAETYEKCCSDDEPEKTICAHTSKGVASCDKEVVSNEKLCSKHLKKTPTVPKAKTASSTQPTVKLQPVKFKASKDDSGRFILSGDQSFVIKSASEKIVIGKIVNDKQVPLSDSDVEFCKENKLRFDVPSKKSIEDVIDEITGDGEISEDDVNEDDADASLEEEELLDEED